MQLEHIMHF